MTHTAEQPALVALFQPMFVEISFGFFGELRDINGLRLAILVRPVERSRIFRGATPPTAFLLADPHPELLGVNDLLLAKYAPLCLGASLLIRFQTVAKHAQRLALCQFGSESFDAAVPRPPRILTATMYFVP